MSSTPRVLSEVGLVESRPDAASAQNPPAAETAGPSNGATVRSPAEKAKAAVEDFLRVIDTLPDALKLKTLRDRFTEMNVPERTDEEFLLSPTFRNVLKLAVVRCQERPSKAKVHIREVINNMRLNTPKTPEQRQRLLELQRRRIRAQRSSETVLERTYLAFDVCVKKIRAAEKREESEDDDSSVEANYVYLDRLQKRAVDLYKKIQKLEGNRYETIVETESPITVRCTPYPEINRATAKMAKRCVKRGMTPDYRDVFIIVKRISEQDDLGLSEDKKRSVATSVFREIIDQIKNRRTKETMRNMESLEIELAEGDQEDPAAENEELRKRLEQQTAEGKQKLDAVIDKFADKQARGRTSSDSEDSGPKKKKPRSENVTNGHHNGDGDRRTEDRAGEEEEAEDGGDGSDGDDSSEVSVVDEKYLETESSENEESEEIDCDEIIKRYGQDRERPQAEVADHHAGPSSASPQLAITNGIEEINPPDEGDHSGEQHKGSEDIIELSSSGDDIEHEIPIRPPKRVIPKRLSTLGRPIDESEIPANPDEGAHDNLDLKVNSPQEVIEISD